MCDECSLCHVLPPHGCGVWAQESLPPDVKYLHIEREGGREGRRGEERGRGSRGGAEEGIIFESLLNFTTFISTYLLYGFPETVEVVFNEALPVKQILPQ